jgi:hypothetical protein
MAGDLFTLGDVLGSAVEQQVVETLNSMRPVWDPDAKYQLYSFIRQGQTFPDVLLRNRETPSDILMGAELKGWYLLAKEAMPNFRFTVNAGVCNTWDLLVVVPWALSSVLSGRPIVFTPWVEGARYAAKYRNYWWQHVRASKGASPGIAEAEDVKPYPTKADRISDVPDSDGGGNFGRIARTGLLNDYIEGSLRTSLCGVQAQAWIDFFKRNTPATRP